MAKKWEGGVVFKWVVQVTLWLKLLLGETQNRGYRRGWRWKVSHWYCSSPCWHLPVLPDHIYWWEQEEGYIADAEWFLIKRSTVSFGRVKKNQPVENWWGETSFKSTPWSLFLTAADLKAGSLQDSTDRETLTQNHPQMSLCPKTSDFRDWLFCVDCPPRGNRRMNTPFSLSLPWLNNSLHSPGQRPLLVCVVPSACYSQVSVQFDLSEWH